MTDWPRITLVTPSFNQGSYLEATLQSVLSQGYPNLEYLLVDGGSTDESVDIIRKYASQLSWWVSEADSGQSDALIKGFDRGTGVLMNWLNSDDQLRPGALFEVARAYLDSGAELLVGQDRQFMDDAENPVSRFTPSGYRYPGCLRFWDGEFRYHQPPTFFTRAAYVRAGGLNPALHFAMDYHLYCKMLSADTCRVSYLEVELTAFRLHPAAKTSRHKAGFIKELREISQESWPAGWGKWELDAMNRYCAKCSISQGAEAMRARKWRDTGRLLGAAFGYQPQHAAKLLLGHLFGRREV